MTAATAGLPGREFKGKVSQIDSRVDPVSRSIAVRAELPNPKGELRPGMFMTVKLQGEVAPALAGAGKRDRAGAGPYVCVRRRERRRARVAK